MIGRDESDKVNYHKINGDDDNDNNATNDDDTHDNEYNNSN